MSPIVTTVEILRPAEEVFTYAIDPRGFCEWQPDVVDGRMDDSPIRVGSRCITTRRIGGTEREVVSEITEYDPPRRWADHGISGPIRGIVSVTVEPLDDPAGSRVTIELDFEGHGIGKLLVPLFVRRQARRDMPRILQALKERLESRSGGGQPSSVGGIENRAERPLGGDRR